MFIYLFLGLINIKILIFSTFNAFIELKIYIIIKVCENFSKREIISSYIYFLKMTKKKKENDHGKNIHNIKLKISIKIYIVFKLSFYVH